MVDRYDKTVSKMKEKIVLLMSLPHTRFDVSNMVDALQEAETAYSSGAPESTTGFLVGSMLFICF